MQPHGHCLPFLEFRNDSVGPDRLVLGLLNGGLVTGVVVGLGGLGGLGSVLGGGGLLPLMVTFKELGARLEVLSRPGN